MHHNNLLCACNYLLLPWLPLFRQSTKTYLLCKHLTLPNIGSTPKSITSTTNPLRPTLNDTGVMTFTAKIKLLVRSLFTFVVNTLAQYPLSAFSPSWSEQLMALLSLLLNTDTTVNLNHMKIGAQKILSTWVANKPSQTLPNYSLLKAPVKTRRHLLLEAATLVLCPPGSECTTLTLRSHPGHPRVLFSQSLTFGNLTTKSTHLPFAQAKRVLIRFNVLHSTSKDRVWIVMMAKPTTQSTIS